MLVPSWQLRKLRERIRIRTLLPAQLGGGATRGRDRSRGSAADAFELVVARQAPDELRVHDPARDAALHDEIARQELGAHRRH